MINSETNDCLNLTNVTEESALINENNIMLSYNYYKKENKLAYFIIEMNI